MTADNQPLKFFSSWGEKKKGGYLMQPLFDVDLNKPEEFTSEAELLPFQPSTSSMLQCVTFQRAVCSKSFKTRSGQQFGE